MGDRGLKPPADDEAALLHAGGRPGRWGNLGLWSEGCDYAAAAEALALAVGRAAGLTAGQRVISVACGAGAELALWRSAFGVGEAIGVERDAARVAQAAQAAPTGARVLAGEGLDAADGVFDAVLCVDAAYHLSPRERFLRQALAALRPGGALAYTDLVLDATPASRWRRGLVHAGARLAGLSLHDILDEAGQVQRLQSLGFTDVRLQRMDEPVLGGFVRFVQVQRQRLGARAHGAAWRRIAGTAALIPPCRSAGLGYALLSARAPGGRDAPPAP